MSYYPNRQVNAFYNDGLAPAAGPPMGMPSYESYAVNPVAQLQITTAGNAMGGPVGPPLPAQHRPSSGAWNPDDDRTLLQLRAMGKNWNQIQREAFPGKTGNACRKRHERLMERRGQNEWDNRKIERLSKEYMSMRKEIWQPLAQRVGEKWNVVEMQCMSNGLKNIQSHARSYARRERLESGQPHAYDDDSGISGIGLTPIDEDLPEHDDNGYSSPEGAGAHSTPGASSTGGGSSTASHHTAYGMHHQQQHHTQHQHHHSQAYGQSYGYQPQHGYSNSVSSTGTAGYGQQQGGTGSQGTSPYMGHNSRLPSVGDMGIDAIINRGPGHSGV
ncbi:hypothetical protein B0H67DRAFT_598557 [Lasiosphaeris hirsuta]|uniref:Myb-like domain-containing protein n=1 Tax=Lasiosphaeris hirsuta TaxID=260670 RepID=A0AA40B092_9PEZI|nr:hypothetical protein B0H67DRAFT_598557 [Lasiosphaeris hirsuta]